MVLKVLVLLFSKHSLRQRSAQVRKFGVEIIFLNNPLMKKKTVPSKYWPFTSIRTLTNNESKN